MGHFQTRNVPTSASQRPNSLAASHGKAQERLPLNISFLCPSQDPDDEVVDQEAGAFVVWVAIKYGRLNLMAKTRK